VGRCTKLVSVMFLFLTVTSDVVLRNVGRICKYSEFTLRHYTGIAYCAFGQVAVLTYEVFRRGLRICSDDTSPTFKAIL